MFEKCFRDLIENIIKSAPVDNFLEDLSTSGDIMSHNISFATLYIKNSQ